MAIDKTTAVAQLDAILASFKTVGHMTQTEAVITMACAAITRFSPPGSAYPERMKAALSVAIVGGNAHVRRAWLLQGVLLGLREDYQQDRMQTFEELVHANLFSDFLDMADHFLSQGHRVPAATVAGGVLEEHLRKLSARFALALGPNATINPMNDELKKANAYGLNEHKQVTAWAGIRNSAAHLKPDEFTAEQVRLMIDGIRHFIGAFPA